MNISISNQSARRARALNPHEALLQIRSHRIYVSTRVGSIGAEERMLANIAAYVCDRFASGRARVRFVFCDWEHCHFAVALACALDAAASDALCGRIREAFEAALGSGGVVVFIDE